jgi:hypothetical protein
MYKITLWQLDENKQLECVVEGPIRIETKPADMSSPMSTYKQERALVWFAKNYSPMYLYEDKNLQIVIEDAKETRIKEGHWLITHYDSARNVIKQELFPFTNYRHQVGPYPVEYKEVQV